ncbi:MAG: hypothetical protein KC587_18065, partial [Nitrospira sp.]|nr:hypothetical protein [Nitrospira sp.]
RAAAPIYWIVFFDALSSSAPSIISFKKPQARTGFHCLTDHVRFALEQRAGKSGIGLLCFVSSP